MLCSTNVFFFNLHSSPYVLGFLSTLSRNRRNLGIVQPELRYGMTLMQLLADSDIDNKSETVCVLKFGKVVKMYENAAELVETFNTALSGHFVILTGMGIVSFSKYLSSPLDMSMDNENHFEIILHISFAILFFFIGAEGCCKVSFFYPHFTEANESIQCESLILVAGDCRIYF